MKYYLEDVREVFKRTESSENGLSQSEAERRLEKYGKNKLAQAKQKSLVRRFFEQLADPMIIILIVAAVISAVTTVYEGKVSGSPSFPTDTVIILAVVLINAVLGVLQESKAEKAIEALQEMSAATSKVIREGRIMTVKSEDLTVGDIVVLEAGLSPFSARATAAIFRWATERTWRIWAAPLSTDAARPLSPTRA